MEPQSAPQRLISLDIFRGLTITGMLIVNNPGTWSYVFKPLSHAEWHGWTPTDLIFPFFLFIVGMAIPLSLDKSLKQNFGVGRLFFRVFRRALLLFFLGLFLNRFPFKTTDVRIPGVLQRIAVCYLFSALVYWVAVKKSGEQILVRSQVILALIALLLLGYYLAMKFIPVPGHGAGLWDSKEWNLAAYVDRRLLGRHLWAYAHRRWDPEGVLSTVPAIASTLSGVLACWWLRQDKSPWRKLGYLLAAGMVLVLLGQALNPFFPINKALWTSTYVCLSSGLALIVFGLCYVYADILGRRFGTLPFRILGSNAILVFFCSTYLVVWLNRLHAASGASLYDRLYQTCFQSLFYSPYLNSLAFALAYALFWLILASGFYFARVFIRL